MASRRACQLGVLGLAAALALCGCGRSAGGQMTDLFISNQRYVIDDTREVVHVYGRLDNGGAARFRQVEVQVTLLSRNGSSRGENSVILQSIQPRERRLFAVDVTSHGRVSDVVVKIREPNAP